MTSRTKIIHIGRISGAFGLRGELKLFHDSGEHERLSGIKELFFLRGKCHPEADATGMSAERVLSLRYSGRTPILRISGVEGRDAAEALVGTEVYADRNSLAPLAEDSFYAEDLTGFAVVGEEGEQIGSVAGILGNPAHDILRISPGGDAKEILLPMVDVFIVDINKEAQLIEVRLPEGLL